MNPVAICVGIVLGSRVVYLVSFLREGSLSSTTIKVTTLVTDVGIYSYNLLSDDKKSLVYWLLIAAFLNYLNFKFHQFIVHHVN